MSGPEERYEPGPEIAELPSSRIFDGSVRGSGEPVFVQVLARSDEELAALAEPLEKGARALSDAGVPGRPVEWDVTSRPGWIVYDRHGEPLATAMRRGRDPGLVDSVAIETAVALDVLGKMGLAHRALNPRTLFQQNRRVAVLGLDALRASYTVARADTVAPNDPRYTAPEAFDGGGDIRADVYSLGCVLFALMTGGPPYFGSAQDLREVHRTQPIPTIPGDDALGWNELIGRMLAKDPAARPQPADIAALVRKARQRSFAALPVAPAPITLRRSRSRAPLVVAGAALVIVLLAGAGASVVLAPGGSPGSTGPAGSPTPSVPGAAATALVAVASAIATAPEATPEATAAPTAAGTARPVVTVRPTVAPTPPPAPTPAPVQVLRVTPTVGSRGTVFRIEAGPLPPGAIFQTNYSTPSRGESPSIASGIVGADGVARTSHGTDQSSEVGPYEFRVFVPGQVRIVRFQVTN